MNPKIAGRNRIMHDKNKLDIHSVLRMGFFIEICQHIENRAFFDNFNLFFPGNFTTFNQYNILPS